MAFTNDDRDEIKVIVRETLLEGSDPIEDATEISDFEDGDVVPVVRTEGGVNTYKKAPASIFGGGGGTGTVTGIKIGTGQKINPDSSGVVQIPNYQPGAQVNPGVMVGSGSSHASGLVPDPGATEGISKFLCENGTWAVPPGGGGGGGTVTGVKVGQAQTRTPVNGIVEIPQKDIKLAMGTITEADIANKVYDSSVFSGLGKAYLPKNIVQQSGNNKNILDQSFFKDSNNNPLINTVFVIQYDYELGENITIPEGCTLEFDGGSIKGRKITLSNNCHIVGGKFTTCLIEATGVTNIVIEDSVFDGERVSMETMADFRTCSYVTFKNLTFMRFEHQWTDNFNLVRFDHCNNVVFRDITFDDIYPEGPWFSYCSNLVIDKVTHIDTRDMGSHLHIFYSENVRIQNCYFVHPRLQGSTINVCAKNVVIANCTFNGGQGIDISNETDINFTSENVIITGCTIENTEGFGIYTYPTHGSVHDVVIDSCKINVWRALGATDAYNVKCINSSISCSGTVNINGQPVPSLFLYNGKTTANKTNGNISVENCEISCEHGFLDIMDGAGYDGGFTFKNCRIAIGDDLIVWSSTVAVPKIEFIDDMITASTSKREIYPSKDSISIGISKYENCIIKKLTFRAISNRQFINNDFEDCYVQAYQNHVFKNNTMRATNSDASVYSFEYSDFENSIISENDFGGRYIDVRQGSFAAKMVFENNSNYVISRGVSGITEEKIKNTLLSRNTYSLNIGPSGITGDRPNNPPIGFCYLDTSISKPIWWTGDTSGGKTGWIDATGASV